MKELIALSHSAAKKLTFASAGVTSVSQLVWDVVRDGAKIEAIDVPYRGGGPAMADLIAGHVDLTLPSSQVAKPLVDTNRIKCLAVTGKTRSPALAKVPTLEEAGHQARRRRSALLVRGVRAEEPAGRCDGEIAAGDKAVAGIAGAERTAQGARHRAGIRGRPRAATRVVSDVKNWGAFIQAAGLKGQ